MPNKKHKVSLDDYAPCYQYFHRAIQNNRFMKDEQCNAVRAMAIQSFSESKDNAHDYECVHQLQSWPNNLVDSATWSRCYCALNQKKYLVDNNQRNITISDEAYNILKDLANKKNIKLSQLIIDGYTFLQGNDEESAKPPSKVLEIGTLRPLNACSTPSDSPSKMIVPVNSSGSDIIPLFGEELIEPHDDGRMKRKILILFILVKFPSGLVNQRVMISEPMNPIKNTENRLNVYE